MSSPIVVQDARIDPDRMILASIDTTKGPRFRVAQIGEVFFARTPHWVRWQEDEHRFVLDGDPECRHFAEVERTTEKISDGKIHSSVTKGKESWIVDGFCSHCGGRAVGQSKTASGSRIYTLSDIEEMIHALAYNGAINAAQASNALLVVQTIAKIHGFL